MEYRVVPPAPYAFGQKSATFTAGLARKTMPALFSLLGAAKRNTGNVALDKILPTGVGGLSAYGTYQSVVPEDATLAQKAEGAVASGLTGFGAMGLARRSAWKNIAEKARRLDAKQMARGYESDLSNIRGKLIKKDLLLPKAGYLALSAAPIVHMQGMHALSNVGEMSGSGRDAARNLAAVSETWKQLADSAAQKDQSGDDVVSKMRKALEQVSGDATRASGAIAQGTEDVSRDISTGVKDVTGTISKGTKDITDALAGAAKNTEGMAIAGKDVAEGLKPLGELVSEITTKDEKGKSIVANLNRVAANTADYTDPEKGELKKQLESYGETLKKFKHYAPYVGGGLAGAAGLYALYKFLSRKKKKAARPEFRPGYGY